MAVEDGPVDAQCAGAALAHAGTVIFPVEFQRVLARRERVFTLPLHALQLDKVPAKDRLALEQIEAIAGEPAAIGHQHSLRATLRNFDLRRDRVGPIEQTRRVAGSRQEHVGQDA